VEADDLVPEVDLLHMIEMQRNFPSPLSMRTQFKEREQSNVGGYAQLTSIMRDGILQRVLVHWPDQIGAPINPDKMDWAKWRAEHPRK
jgi:hypothetical protein